MSKEGNIIDRGSIGNAGGTNPLQPRRGASYYHESKPRARVFPLPMMLEDDPRTVCTTDNRRQRTRRQKMLFGQQQLETSRYEAAQSSERCEFIRD